MPEDPQFAQLVVLACHDLRTPLATVHGFAHTLARQETDETSARYLEMITSASAQLGELIDELSVAARIESGRYGPPLREMDTLELARAAAARLGEDRVGVSGDGAQVELDVDAAERALAALVKCALRHGGLERVELTVRGAELELTPVTQASAPVLVGAELRDLGAAVAVRVLRARGGDATVEDDVLRVRLA